MAKLNVEEMGYLLHVEGVGSISVQIQHGAGNSPLITRKSGSPVFISQAQQC